MRMWKEGGGGGTELSLACLAQILYSTHAHANRKEKLPEIHPHKFSSRGEED